jgi:hypothetical protein
MDNDSKQKEKLQRLLGNWEGITSTWFEPGKPAVEETNRGTFKVGVNENFVVYEYESTLQGSPFKGMAMYGYDAAQKKFQSSWVDSFHMGGAIMFSEGESTESGFSIIGSYLYESVRYNWRTNLEIVNDDEITLTSYYISLEGEESKAVETVYKRVSK